MGIYFLSLLRFYQIRFLCLWYQSQAWIDVHSSLDVVVLIITWSAIVFTPSLVLQSLKNDKDRITLNRGKLSSNERREWCVGLEGWLNVELPRSKKNPWLKTFQDRQVKCTGIDANIWKFLQVHTSLVGHYLLASWPVSCRRWVLPWNGVCWSLNRSPVNTCKWLEFRSHGISRNSVSAHLVATKSWDPTARSRRNWCRNFWTEVQSPSKTLIS